MNKVFSLIFILLYTGLFAESEWTVLVYIAADNNLFNNAFKDINEMEQVGSSDSVNIIVQIDPLDDATSHFDSTEARRYYITKDYSPSYISSTLLVSLGEINSADPKEVYKFANWGFEEYPSRKKMLIIWDHGNGWSKEDQSKSICNDDESGDNISVADGELKTAISNINYHLDILAFDACLMQTVEVIGEVYEYCDFIIGSEDRVPVDGFPYGDIYKDGIFNYLTENPQCTPREFSKEIVERYVNSYLSGQQSGSHLTLSAINTDYYPIFQSQLFDFTEKYSKIANDTIFLSARDSCYQFDNEIDIDEIDIYEFFYMLSRNVQESDISQDVDSLISIIDSLASYKLAYDTNYNGHDIGRAKIFFPNNYWNFCGSYPPGSTWQKYYQLDFTKNTRWDRFLDFYYNQDTSPPYIPNLTVNSVADIANLNWTGSIDPTYIYYEVQISYGGEEYITIDDSLQYETKTIYMEEGYNYFRVRAIDEFENKSDWSDTLSAFVDVTDNLLLYFYPNPFLPQKDDSAHFIYKISQPGNISIYIYNIVGELVWKYSKNHNVKGTHIKSFDGKNQKGKSLASGVYIAIIKFGNQHKKLKFAIVR